MSELSNCTGDPLSLVARPAPWRHSREPVTASADLWPPCLLKEARLQGFGLLSVIHEGFLLCAVSMLHALTNLHSWSLTCPHFTSGDTDKLGYLLMAVVVRSKLSRGTEV